MRGLVDFGRIETMLERIGDRIDHVRLSRVTPLAAPLFLEPGRVPVDGLANQRLMEEEAEKADADGRVGKRLTGQRQALRPGAGAWHGTDHERPQLRLPRRDFPRAALGRALLAVGAASGRYPTCIWARPNAAARRGGPMLPPYEGIDTLLRLSGDISATTPRTVSSALATVSTTRRQPRALDEVTARPISRP